MKVGHYFKYASVLGFSIVSLVLSGCSQPSTQQSKEQGLFFWQDNSPIKILKTESGDDIPERVAKFLADAEQFGRGVQRYSLGSWQRTVTDCSGFLAQAHRSAGYNAFGAQFDYDVVNFAGCQDQLRAGDVLLLNYPGRQPDHWIMMVDVRDPRGKFNSEQNIIMDVSSDYVDGKPFYKGSLSRRRNLLARQVYACRRHRSFDADWRKMTEQLKEEAKKRAEAQALEEAQRQEQEAQQGANPQQQSVPQHPASQQSTSPGGEVTENR